MSLNPDHLRVDKIGSASGDLNVLIEHFRDFYGQSHRLVFDMVVKQVWLERQFTYDGEPRTKRKSNGFSRDWAFGYFMRSMVGISQKPVTLNFCFTAVSTYIKDFFPDFLERNPFEEQLTFPFKYVTLDHLVFVYMHHERIEMLQHAEEKHMTFGEFFNWAINQSFCYNDEVGDSVYVLTSSGYMWPHLKNTRKEKGWQDEHFVFEGQKGKTLPRLKRLPKNYKRLA